MIPIKDKYKRKDLYHFSLNIPIAEIERFEFHLINWNNKNNFWSEVYKDVFMGNPFEDISEFITSVLILPHSNYHVKRIFKYIIKSKFNNRSELQN